MLTVNIDQQDGTILTVQIKFHRARYIITEVTDAVRGGKVKVKTRQLMAKDKVPRDAQMVCDTTCRILLSSGGEHLGTLEGFSKMSPLDVGKYNKSYGRKTSLRRVMDNHSLTLAGTSSAIDLGFNKRARGIIWREYFRNFDVS